jgi:hypothetical protein
VSRERVVRSKRGTATLINLLRCGGALHARRQVKLSVSAWDDALKQLQAQRTCKEAAVKLMPNVNQILIEDPAALQVLAKAQTKMQAAR